MGIADGRYFHPVREELIAEGREVGRIEIKEDSLLAGNDGIGGLGKHKFCALALDVRPDQFPLRIVENVAQGEAEQSVEIDGALYVGDERHGD